MKLKPITTLIMSIFIIFGLSISTNTLAAEVRVEGKTVHFKGLKERDIRVVERTLNTAVKRTINKLSAGEFSSEKKDCRRVDLTNKQICVEITIETIPD